MATAVAVDYLQSRTPLLPATNRLVSIRVRKSIKVLLFLLELLFLLLLLLLLLSRNYGKKENASHNNRCHHLWAKATATITIMLTTTTKTTKAVAATALNACNFCLNHCYLNKYRFHFISSMLLLLFSLASLWLARILFCCRHTFA